MSRLVFGNFGKHFLKNGMDKNMDDNFIKVLLGLVLTWIGVGLTTWGLLEEIF